MPYISPYLTKPLRTLEQAKEDIQADNAKAELTAWRRRKAEQELAEVKP